MVQVAIRATVHDRKTHFNGCFFRVTLKFGALLMFFIPVGLAFNASSIFLLLLGFSGYPSERNHFFAIFWLIYVSLHGHETLQLLNYSKLNFNSTSFNTEWNLRNNKNFECHCQSQCRQTLFNVTLKIHPLWRQRQPFHLEFRPIIQNVREFSSFDPCHWYDENW